MSVIKNWSLLGGLEGKDNNRWDLSARRRVHALHDPKRDHH
jgi:hypothetical protein